MCDYCDCRSQPAIGELSAEHESMLALVGRIRSAVATSDLPWLAALQVELGFLLAAHTSREERGVFAALRDTDVDPAYLGRFEADHRAIDELLAGAVEPERALSLARLLEEHIRREESDLFPAAHQLVPPERWQAVEELHAAGGA